MDSVSAENESVQAMARLPCPSSVPRPSCPVRRALNRPRVSDAPTRASLSLRSTRERETCPPACPVCGGKLVEQRGKLVCSRCRTICETCCEGGRG